MMKFILRSVVGGDFRGFCVELSLIPVTCSMVAPQFRHYVRNLPLELKWTNNKKLVGVYFKTFR